MSMNANEKKTNRREVKVKIVQVAGGLAADIYDAKTGQALVQTVTRDADFGRITDDVETELRRQRWSVEGR